MRNLRLAQIAVQAEGLRLRRLARRTATRIVLVLVALPFLLATFGFLEAALWNWVSRHLVPEFAALITAGVNLLVGGVFMAIAAASSDSTVEIEALKVRERALEDVRRELTVTALLAPVARLVVDQLRRRRERR
jgi:hypothetical protein